MKPTRLILPTDKGTLGITLSKTRNLQVLIEVQDDRTGENVRMAIPAAAAVELSKALVAFAIELKQEIRNTKLPDTVDGILEMIDRPPVALKANGDPIVVWDIKIDQSLN